MAERTAEKWESYSPSIQRLALNLIRAGAGAGPELRDTAEAFCKVLVPWSEQIQADTRRAVVEEIAMVIITTPCTRETYMEEQSEMRSAIAANVRALLDKQ